MGFCRRCGDIIHAEKCSKCGGGAVGPTVKWQKSRDSNQPSDDKWIRTYVVSEKSASSISPSKVTVPRTPITSTRFSSRVSAHIASATSNIRPASPLKRSAFSAANPPSPSTGILPVLGTDTLAKVYGSVLQPPESLASFACASCRTTFQPDSTLYPAPDDPDPDKFYCWSCFLSHDGSLGACANCGHHVLRLKSDGGHVENSGKIWHMRCFRCEGCFKDISTNPMVDLLGKPCCADCFDTCLTRDRDGRSPRRTSQPSTPRSRSNPGGLKSRSRESSPTIEELQIRLGIPTSSGKKLPSPKFEATAESPLSRRSPKTQRSSMSKSYATGIPTTPTKPSTPPREARPHPRLDTSALRPLSFTSTPTPDLTNGSLSSRASSTSTSPLHTPPNGSTNGTPTLKKKASRLDLALSTSPISSLTVCAACQQPIFTSGQAVHDWVTLREQEAVYHASCFRCTICQSDFAGRVDGTALYVATESGPCHAECVPRKQIVQTLRQSRSIADDHPKTAPPTSRSFPPLGGKTSCPKCHKAVFPMESGVVPGPQGTRWHNSCLVCGGQERRWDRRRDDKVPGCGKRLDAAAKMDREGRIWCRECLLLLPTAARASPSPSPTRIGMMPTGDRVFPQFTGTTTIARQMTGSGAPLARQLTGGGLSPTRSLAPSPTKQLGRRYPRPKSVMGILRE